MQHCNAATAAYGFFANIYDKVKIIAFDVKLLNMSLACVPKNRKLNHVLFHGRQ
jgi:hypothetical protein